jgi:hypothetical protein
LMHSKWSEWVLASGRLPTLVSAAPTIAYLPLMFDIKSSEENRWSVPLHGTPPLLISSRYYFQSQARHFLSPAFSVPG